VARIGGWVSAAGAPSPAAAEPGLAEVQVTFPARRLARQTGHGERADPIQMMVGAAFLLVFLRVCCALAWG
jgi:hypothetical protein